mmetsp:Transcript_17443/g.41446  ORF Transcript_17443/g.41446 Transcript_17443/m.41446 type:complete len:268 (-) Transcript_17443:661-1464(-)
MHSIIRSSGSGGGGGVSCGSSSGIGSSGLSSGGASGSYARPQSAVPAGKSWADLEEEEEEAEEALQHQLQRQLHAEEAVLSQQGELHGQPHAQQQLPPLPDGEDGWRATLAITTVSVAAANSTASATAAIVVATATLTATVTATIVVATAEAAAPAPSAPPLPDARSSPRHSPAKGGPAGSTQRRSSASPVPFRRHSAAPPPISLAGLGGKPSLPPLFLEIGGSRELLDEGQAKLVGEQRGPSAKPLPLPLQQAEAQGERAASSGRV